MEVPITRLLGFEFDGMKPAAGQLCHVILHEEESTGRDRMRAHVAANCDNWTCALTERTKYPKHAHVGSRYWATPQGDHVVVGVESFVDEKMWGKQRMTRYTLVPVSQPRSTTQRILEHA